MADSQLSRGPWERPAASSMAVGAAVKPVWLAQSAIQTPEGRGERVAGQPPVARQLSRGTWERSAAYPWQSCMARTIAPWSAWGACSGSIRWPVRTAWYHVSAEPLLTFSASPVSLRGALRQLARDLRSPTAPGVCHSQL